MIGGVAGVPGFVAFTTRPSGLALVICTIVVAVAWGVCRWTTEVTRPPRVEPDGDRRPPVLDGGRHEPPAVVALLTNDYVVPRSAITATVLDLAARGWIRLADAQGELVVFTRGSGTDGDALRPFEQQVLNHLHARAFDGVTSAGTLAASQRRLDRRWRRRFADEVVKSARRAGLTHRRYGFAVLRLPVAALVIAAIVVWGVWRNGADDVEIAESLAPRFWWTGVALVLLVVAARFFRAATKPSELPTGAGAARQATWLGYRGRLLARIPETASVIAPPEQQVALAHAVVMGVAGHVHDQIPIIDEDDRLAWSEAGGRPHVVRVRYPFRPAYGRQPILVAAVGIGVLLASMWLRGFFERVADGEALQSLIDDVPEQADIIERVAEILAVIAVLPMIWAVWAVVAGTIDTVLTRERTGLVVRARRPNDVVPLPRLLGAMARRDRYAVFLAVDDGARSTVVAWVANERTAAPQGASARIRATPMLGYVRSSEPVGASTRRRATEGTR